MAGLPPGSSLNQQWLSHLCWFEHPCSGARLEIRTLYNYFSSMVTNQRGCRYFFTLFQFLSLLGAVHFFTSFSQLEMTGQSWIYFSFCLCVWFKPSKLMKNKDLLLAAALISVNVFTFWHKYFLFVNSSFSFSKVKKKKKSTYSYFWISTVIL